MGRLAATSSAPLRFALEDPIRSFLQIWGDPEAPLEDLLDLLHPLAFDLQLPQGRVRGREGLLQVRQKVAARPLQAQYRLKRLGPPRDTTPPGGYRVAAQVVVHQSPSRATRPIPVVFEFRRTSQGELRIARIEPAG